MKKIILTPISFCLAALLALSCFSVQAADGINEKYHSTAQYLLSCPTPEVASIGGEWIVIGLARSGKITKELAEGYYQNAVSFVEGVGSAKLHRSKSTDNSRMIIALTSIGKDVTDIAGFNLLEPLADFSYVKRQGINGVIWALIAFDTLQYEIPISENVSVQTTRERLINYILDNQTTDGGWNLSDDFADPDLTGMAIQSLAPYYFTNAAVKKAVDKALITMSGQQKDSGGFNSYGTDNPESCAQMIVALTALGINPETDARFVKNGSSALDNLMNFSVENGFEHTAGGGFNQMSTEQSYYALTAYHRLLEGETSLYDMSDLLLQYDVNSDGVVNIADATEIQRYVAGLTDFSAREKKLADSDRNGIVNIYDATHIQRVVARLAN